MLPSNRGRWERSVRHQKRPPEPYEVREAPRPMTLEDLHAQTTRGRHLSVLRHRGDQVYGGSILIGGSNVASERSIRRWWTKLLRRFRAQSAEQHAPTIRYCPLVRANPVETRCHRLRRVLLIFRPHGHVQISAPSRCATTSFACSSCSERNWFTSRRICAATISLARSFVTTSPLDARGAFLASVVRGRSDRRRFSQRSPVPGRRSRPYDARHDTASPACGAAR